MEISFKRITLFTIICCLLGCGGDTEKKEPSIVIVPQKFPSSSLTENKRNEKLTYIEAYNEALTLWHVPFEEKDISTNFGNAHIIICGSINAEPIVLLHGMNASSTMWYPNIKSLSEKYRVYAIDFLLEPGKSSCEKKISNTDEIVNWYYTIFDKLNLKKFNLIGASRGGWLSLNIALHCPSRINKIVLLSPAQAFIWIKPQAKIITNLTYAISPKRKHLRNVLQTMTFDVDKIDQVYINQYYIATEETTFNRCILQMTPFSNSQLKSLTMPILLMIGDNDIINNDKSLERAKKTIPNLEAVKIKNSGHFLSVDQPEIVDTKILVFLNENKNLSAKK
jgi:pimeloyl-ACP methyl ester carboxylesterase